MTGQLKTIPFLEFLEANSCGIVVNYLFSCTYNATCAYVFDLARRLDDSRRAFHCQLVIHIFWRPQDQPIFTDAVILC